MSQLPKDSVKKRGEKPPPHKVCISQQNINMNIIGNPSLNFMIWKTIVLNFKERVQADGNV